MRKLLVTLNDELSKELAKYPNQSEIVRDALRVYNNDISTDTVRGLRQSYALIIKRLDDSFAKYDESFQKLDKLIDYLETRM